MSLYIDQSSSQERELDSGFHVVVDSFMSNSMENIYHEKAVIYIII